MKRRGSPSRRNGATWRSSSARVAYSLSEAAFLDYTGIFMLHCHIMNHEEMGMMQTVEVYK